MWVPITSTGKVFYCQIWVLWLNPTYTKKKPLQYLTKRKSLEDIYYILAMGSLIITPMSINYDFMINHDLPKEYFIWLRHARLPIHMSSSSFFAFLIPLIQMTLISRVIASLHSIMYENQIAKLGICLSWYFTSYGKEGHSIIEY